MTAASCSAVIDKHSESQSSIGEVMQKQVQAVRLEPVLLSETHTPAELADDLIRIFGMVDAGFPTDVLEKRRSASFLSIRLISEPTRFLPF